MKSSELTDMEDDLNDIDVFCVEPYSSMIAAYEEFQWIKVLDPIMLILHNYLPLIPQPQSPWSVFLSPICARTPFPAKST